jgi:deuterolysin
MYAYDNLKEYNFHVIPAGGFVEIEYDIGPVYDLTAGGVFSIVTNGHLPLAEANSTLLSGSVLYVSNLVETEIDGQEAAAAYGNALQKRADQVCECDDKQNAVLKAALSDCKNIASRAQKVAGSGPVDRMVEYFKSTHYPIRKSVAEVFYRTSS